MTANRRIFLNIIATYGRSLYALVIGLFCGRWTLMALGEVDYGLMGVVGGLTAFISFLNGIMASGVGRFYALSVGEEQKDPVGGLEKCREWFTTAVVIHTVLPIVLMVIGYPIGEWAVRHFLTIPPDRIDACVWVWRFTCVSCFVGMASVPYHAMYGAKQEIAELTIYSFITTTVNVVFLYYVLHHPGDWLSRIALWGCALSVLPSLIITFRSIVKYKECRLRFQYIHLVQQVRRMLSYSSWILIGSAAALLRGQGVVIVINKLFGPRVNAAAAIGNTLSGHCETLSGSLLGAFSPAIMNAYGAGKKTEFCEYANRACRYSTALVLVFALPMMSTVDDVLVLWLKNPPMYTGMFCVLALALTIIDKMTWGYVIAIHAVGKIALYQCLVGGAMLLALPLSFVLYWAGAGVYCAALASIVVFLVAGVLRMLFARVLLGISIRSWLRSCVAPLAVIIILGGTTGCGMHMVCNLPALSRIVVVTGTVLLVTLPVYWMYLLSSVERAFVVGFVKRKILSCC